MLEIQIYTQKLIQTIAIEQYVQEFIILINKTVFKDLNYPLILIRET